jgi:hypothetical protein
MLVDESTLLRELGLLRCWRCGAQDQPLKTQHLDWMSSPLFVVVCEPCGMQVRAGLVKRIRRLIREVEQLQRSA